MADIVIHVADEEEDAAVFERIDAELAIISAALSEIVQHRIGVTQDPTLVKAALLTAYHMQVESIMETEQ